jgi:hypothetical protein
MFFAFEVLKSKTLNELDDIWDPFYQFKLNTYMTLQPKYIF